MKKKKGHDKQCNPIFVSQKVCAGCVSFGRMSTRVLVSACGIMAIVLLSLVVAAILIFPN